MLCFQENSDSSQITIVKDLLNFKTKAANVLRHPVIEAFLESKWRVVKVYFVINLVMYFVFLMIYSVYITAIFIRDPHTTGGGGGQLDDGDGTAAAVATTLPVVGTACQAAVK